MEVFGEHVSRQGLRFVINVEVDQDARADDQHHHNEPPDCVTPAHLKVLDAAASKFDHMEPEHARYRINVRRLVGRRPPTVREGLSMRILSMLLAVCMLPGAVVAQGNDVDTRRKQLNQVLDDYWEYTMRTSPEYASILGDKRYNDKLSDASYAAVLRDLDETKKYVARLEAVDTTGFPEQEQLNKELLLRQLKMGLEGARFKTWEMPVTQFNGIHIDAPQLVSLLSFE